MTMRIFLPLAVLLTLPFLCSAQTLTGRILDGETGEPVPFATLVTGVNKGTISN